MGAGTIGAAFGPKVEVTWDVVNEQVRRGVITKGILLPLLKLYGRGQEQNEFGVKYNSHDLVYSTSSK